MGLSLLSHSSLPYYYWDHDFHTAVYLINRIPAAHTKLIPSQTLFKTPPNYLFLKSFGCACYPLLHPYNQHKLQYRSTQCIFLGYSSSHKGYKCLDTDTGKLYISKDVIYDETHFPFQNQTTQTHTTPPKSPLSTTSTTLGIIPPSPTPPQPTPPTSPSSQDPLTTNTVICLNHNCFMHHFIPFTITTTKPSLNGYKIQNWLLKTSLIP